MAGLILYSGALAQVPRQGGLTWLHLQFLLGLRRLGWDVLFLDRLEPEMCVDATGRDWQPTDSPKKNASPVAPPPIRAPSASE